MRHTLTLQTLNSDQTRHAFEYSPNQFLKHYQTDLDSFLRSSQEEISNNIISYLVEKKISRKYKTAEIHSFSSTVLTILYFVGHKVDMPTIVHFDIPAEDVERSQKFYTELFGWKIEKFSEDTPAGEYWLITITDDKGNKVLSGGMHKRMFPEQQITNYIDVKSVDEYCSKIEKLGGKVVRNKTPVPGMGFFAFCTDTENNMFAIWETNENAK